jgi:hypothetical protein
VGLVGVSAEAEPPQRGGLGASLVDELNLRLVNCTYFHAIDESSGYCLDAVASSEWEAMVVSVRLRGHEPSPADKRVFDLTKQVEQRSDELEETGDPAVEAALLQTLAQLREAQAVSNYP